MTQPMNQVVDGVLLAFQERILNVEMTVADIRDELLALRREFEAFRGDDMIIPARDGNFERRLVHVERRVEAWDKFLT